jgi:hypothetical protein
MSVSMLYNTTRRPPKASAQWVTSLLDGHEVSETTSNLLEYTGTREARLAVLGYKLLQQVSGGKAGLTCIDEQLLLLLFETQRAHGSADPHVHEGCISIDGRGHYWR